MTDVLCKYCFLPLKGDQEEMCDACYEDRSPLWYEFHTNGGPSPLGILFDVAIYEVGGSVRDGLLGIDSKDKDFAVEAPSFDRMREFLQDRGFNIFVETPEFLTIRAHFPSHHPSYGKTTADFVLCRKDGAYSDGRHPDEVTPGTIRDDLARRDFTVNAMARPLSGGDLIDPFDGTTDLQDRILRAVGSPEVRLREDPLRALRALRFMVCKNFIIEHRLRAAIYSDWLAPLLTSVSTERKREELMKMFKHNSMLSAMLFTDSAASPLRRAVFSDGLWLKPTLEEK